MKREMTLKVNGEVYEVFIEPKTTLQDLLRDELGLIGVKKGCDDGMCGACTVLLDGKAVKSCLILALQVQGKEITTIEGLGDGEKLDPIQEAFIEHGALQCGFCTPGMIITSKAFLNENPKPSEEQVRMAISGNLCRCTGYVKIVEAIMAASKRTY
jgi:aerobic-type carbon monoxide dehydrogenase small subunit (CoxS/CutS family)